MAFTVKYRTEITDILGVDWRIDIEEDGTPVMATMQSTGDPLHIEWLTPGDSLILNTIKGSIATINIESTTNFEYVGLYNSGSMVYKVKIYYGSSYTLYWQGWVTTDYTEPYDTPSYTASITAADGLGLLKKIMYDNAGTAYEDRDYQHNILLNIFAKIGYTQFTEYCNIYEDRMDDAVTDSPFVQCMVDNDVFAGMDCYTVLEAILRPYNAIIRQLNGGFVIYRPIELTEAIIYGRIITAASVTGTSIDPDQFLQRPGLTDSSDLIDVNGGVMMMQPPIKKFTALQDYGYKESWIDNRKFIFDSDTHTFEEWTIAGGDNFHPLQYRTGEPEGLLINNVPVYAQNIYQVFGEYARASASDGFRFEVDYKFINATGVAVSPGEFNILVQCGAYYLRHPVADDETVLEWSLTIGTIVISEASVPKGTGQWQTWTRSFASLPEDGPLTIIMYSNLQLSICVNNIRFFAVSDNIVTLKRKKNWASDFLSKLEKPGTLVSFIYQGFSPIANHMLNTPSNSITDVEEIVEHRYEATNAVEGDEISMSYILGDVTDTGIDNVLEQFQGSLCISQTGSLIQTAMDFVASFADDYFALTSPPVILTSIGNILYFESATVGDDFAGASTIVNATGTLTGTVTTIQANSTGTVQIDTITLTGGSGSARITGTSGLFRTIHWDSDLATTAATFVTDHDIDWPEFTITQGVFPDTADLIFTENFAGGGFAHPTIVNLTGNLAGTVDNTQASLAEHKRKDQIVLSGTSGTAAVTVHANAETATFNTDTVLDYTQSWHTRGNAEGIRLLQIAANEVATLYSKGRQFIQLPMEEVEGDPTNFRVTHNLQDPLNVTGADNKCFAVNRASLDVKMRTWTADIIEIGVKAT